MSGLPRLAARHALYRKGRTALLAVGLALAGALPLTSSALMARYRADLVRRADATPLLAGPEGNRFDLTLGALYFRAHGLEPVPMGLLRELEREAEEVGGAVVVPLHTGGSARGRPVVGTTPEYHERRGLVPGDGTRPLYVGDATLGARAAAELDLGVGDTLFSDPRDDLDIATPASLELEVVGVLLPTGTPDDDAVFVDLKTAWGVEGHGHGHADVTEPGALPEGYVLSRTEDQVAVSPALIEERRLTPEDLADFHLHGDPSRLPLSGILIFPSSPKAGTLLRATMDLRPGVQVVVPRRVIDDLLAFVLRIKTLLDRLSLVLLFSTVLFGGLVLVLSAQLRADEFRTLHAIGCGRGAVAQLVAWEVALLLLLGAVLAVILTAVALSLIPDLVQTL